MYVRTYVCTYAWYVHMCVCVCVYIYIYVCVYFLLFHAPLLGVILHVLMWYIQIQCLELVTWINTHYEVSLICLVWWI